MKAIAKKINVRSMQHLSNVQRKCQISFALPRKLMLNLICPVNKYQKVILCRQFSTQFTAYMGNPGIGFWSRRVQNKLFMRVAIAKAFEYRQLLTGNV